MWQIQIQIQDSAACLAQSNRVILRWVQDNDVVIVNNDNRDNNSVDYIAMVNFMLLACFDML